MVHNTQRKFTTYTALVVGKSGSGKSTLINTLFGLKPGDPGYCKVSAVDTGTTAVHAVSPQNMDITLVDTPGFPGDPSGPEVDSEYSELVKNAVRDLQPQLIILMIKMERPGPGVRNQYEVLKEVFSGVPYHKIVLIVSHCGEETSKAYTENVEKCVNCMFDKLPGTRFHGLGEPENPDQRQALQTFLSTAFEMAKTDSISPSMTRSYKDVLHDYQQRAARARAAASDTDLAKRRNVLGEELARAQDRHSAARAGMHHSGACLKATHSLDKLATGVVAAGTTASNVATVVAAGKVAAASKAAATAAVASTAASTAAAAGTAASTAAAAGTAASTAAAAGTAASTAAVAGTAGSTAVVASTAAVAGKTAATVAVAGKAAATVAVAGKTAATVAVAGKTAATIAAAGKTAATVAAVVSGKAAVTAAVAGTAAASTAAVASTAAAGTAAAGGTAAASTAAAGLSGASLLGAGALALGAGLGVAALVGMLLWATMQAHKAEQWLLQTEEQLAEARNAFNNVNQATHMEVLAAKCEEDHQCIHRLLFPAPDHHRQYAGPW